MTYLLIWWLLLLLLGVAAFPVAFRFFARLPDRGYAFAKSLSLLLIVYPFWLLTSLGLLENTFGVIAGVVILLVLLAWGYGFWAREAESPLAWLRKHWRTALAVELVFSFAYFAFAYYRAFNPEIQATEKPMEFMFLNSILKSPTFPPHDSWLSGYAISYYYLGYVIVAMLTRLSAAPSNLAFNLALVMTYALSATAAYGLAFNLIAARRDEHAEEDGKESDNRFAPYAFGLLAAALLLLAGNFEAPFESLHNAGIGSPSLFQFLDVNGLAQAPQSGTLVPEDNWWWWRSSRVVNDHSPVNGDHIEVIDEFPSFSFLLGDLHPHVLALPFGLLALAVAFELFRRPAKSSSLLEAARSWATPGFLLTALVVGSLSMLNTWDIATYGFAVVAAFFLAQARVAGWNRETLIRAFIFGAILVIVAFILFIPFYLGFTSQAGGILPTLVFKTPLQQYLMMFGLFVFLLAGFVAILISRQDPNRRSAILSETFTWVLWSFSIPLAIGILGALVLFISRDLRERVMGLLGLDPGMQTISAVLQALRAYTVAFAYSLLLFLLMVTLLAAILALLRNRYKTGDDDPRGVLEPATAFALILGFTALLLTFGVEFFYIRDTFGTRMNTVFKLYFQAWTLFSIAGTFAAYYVWSKLQGAGRTVWTGAFAVLILLALVFPVLAYTDRANGFQGSEAAGTPTLDGTLWIKNANPEAYAAIQWLNEHAPDDATILEAPGGSYTFTDQISMGTGLATVVGWGGHELQWRGSGDEAGKRERDVEQIYKTTDAGLARTLLDQYHVDYVVVGATERDKYKLASPMIDKFGKLGTMVFSSGSLRIYEIGSVPAQ